MATMITRSGSNVWRRQEAASVTIKALEQRIGALEIKEKLTKADKQSALIMSKLPCDVSADFKNYCSGCHLMWTHLSSVFCPH